jgi:hypothetical protein
MLSNSDYEKHLLLYGNARYILLSGLLPGNQKTQEQVITFLDHFI